MREINVAEISDTISKMCIEINHILSPDMKEALYMAQNIEDSVMGRQVLLQLKKNLDIASEDMIPICQDTGMAVVFLKIGQEVHFYGGDLNEAINNGIRRGYTEGYLRKSVVSDPIIRENTGDNTPAVIHEKIVPGEKVLITLSPSLYPFWNTSHTVSDSASSLSTCLMALWKFGSNGAPSASISVTPSFSRMPLS